MAGPLFPSDDSQGSRTFIRDGLSDRAGVPQDGHTIELHNPPNPSPVKLGRH
jgi:hypothetical protein